MTNKFISISTAHSSNNTSFPWARKRIQTPNGFTILTDNFIVKLKVSDIFLNPLYGINPTILLREMRHQATEW